MKPSDSLQSHLYDIWYSWWFHYISYDFLWNPMSKSPLSFTLENFHRHQKNIDLNPPKGRSQLLLHRVTTSPPHRGASQTCIRPATRAVPQIKTEETKLHLGYVYIYRDIWAVYIYIDISWKNKGSDPSRTWRSLNLDITPWSNPIGPKRSQMNCRRKTPKNCIVFIYYSYITYHIFLYYLCHIPESLIFTNVFLEKNPSKFLLPGRKPGNYSQPIGTMWILCWSWPPTPEANKWNQH